MSKKLQGNGLFESSRMMLPEHKEAYILHQQNLKRNSRPQLDDQEAERLSLIVAESMQFKKEITLILFKEFEERRLTGVVLKINHQQGVLKLQQGGSNVVWINMEDITGTPSSEFR